MSANEKDRTERIAARPSHNIILENRHILSLSGIKDADSFDEQTVTLVTGLGILTVRGYDLHISRFDQDSGEMTLDGEINELIYTDDEHVGTERKGFFSRLLG